MLRTEEGVVLEQEADELMGMSLDFAPSYTGRLRSPTIFAPGPPCTATHTVRLFVPDSAWLAGNSYFERLLRLCPLQGVEVHALAISTK